MSSSLMKKDSGSAEGLDKPNESSLVSEEIKWEGEITWSKARISKTTKRCYEKKGVKNEGYNQRYQS